MCPGAQLHDGEPLQEPSVLHISPTPFTSALAVH